MKTNAGKGAPFQQRIEMTVFKVVQYLYRHLLRSSSFVYRIPCHDFFLKLITPKLNKEELSAIERQLREDIVANHVSMLKNKGISHVRFYILQVESLGDVIACEPICHYLKRLAPTSSITWIVKTNFADIVKAFPLVDNIVTANSLADGFDIAMRANTESDVVVVNCIFDNTQCGVTNQTLRNPNNPSVNLQNHYAFGNLLESFCLAAGIPRINETPILSIETLGHGFDIPDKYIVFHCHSANGSKDWGDDKWNQLGAFVIEKGFAIVEIGFTRTITTENSRYYDWTGKNNLLTLTDIVRKANFFVGVDSAFAHVANAFRMPSVILLGRFAFFDTYSPFSGKFAHSELFKCVRAPAGQYAKSIPVEAVEKALTELMAQPRHPMVRNAAY